MKFRYLHPGAFGFVPIWIAALLFSSVASAESFEFRVVYAEVPGIEKILAGEFRAAIEILEDRRNSLADDRYLVDERATLCALYVVAGRLEDGRKVCQEAVDNDQSHAAYNNRGVLRAHIGDTTGALNDFNRARVRPSELKAYLEQLQRRDSRVIASKNFKLAAEFISRTRAGERRPAGPASTARIEDLNVQY